MFRYFGVKRKREDDAREEHKLRESILFISCLLFMTHFQVVKQLDALAMLEDTDNSTFNINILG